MRFDHSLITCLVPLALWILISGLDDLFICLVFLLPRRKPFPWPTDDELIAAPEHPIAIFVPLWREHQVIGQMLQRNLASVRYCSYDVFVGVYPNDRATRQVVQETARLHPNVHMIVGPHNGPTSKGDCLNWIYQGMVRHEQERGVRYEIVMTHDAEDLVDPDSLRLVNWFSRDYAMVQVPVLPLPTPISEIVHGLYCDEFAEFQTKDIPVRQRLGGFLPANGAGTGFSRTALDHLAATRRGLIFDPDCLTEDYENGFRLHALGYRQIFLPVRLRNGAPVATREYFPRNFRNATRQRSRWVAGIALQGWQHHGWRGSWPEVYWFWRDRKGLVGNLLSPFANLAFLAGLSGAAWHFPVWLDHLCLLTCSVSLVQVIVRSWCSAQIYGWRFACAAPLRATWGNFINFRATVAALAQFAVARYHRRSMAWRKTDHVYPRPLLGEVLVQMRAVPVSVVERAAAELPAGIRIGEYLVRSQQLSEEILYQALSIQTGVPMAPSGVDFRTTRLLPTHTALRLKVLPYRVHRGELHVATVDLPTPELSRELGRTSALKIRYSLLPPGHLAELMEQCRFRS